MKTLHVYPHDNALLAHYVSVLSSAMEGKVETKTAADNHDIASIAEEWQPDIIHIHGNVKSKTLSKHARTVVTPHGEEVAVKAYVVIARSPMEHERLASLGFQRVEEVRNPIITRTISVQETALAMTGIYQRVMDSNVRELMDEPTQEMLFTLLKVGLMGDKQWADVNVEVSSPNWRQLHVYAYYEGVISILRKGMKLLGVLSTAIDPSSIKTYLPDSYAMPELQTSLSLPALLDTIEEEIREGSLSLCRIVQLHQALIIPTLDEGKLLGELDKKRTLLLSRLLAIAKYETLLDEGFMPVAPIDDRQTRHIHNLIIKHLKI